MNILLIYKVHLCYFLIASHVINTELVLSCNKNRSDFVHRKIYKDKKIIFVLHIKICLSSFDQKCSSEDNQ